VTLTVSPAAARKWNVSLSPTASMLRDRVCPHAMGSAQAEGESDTKVRLTSYEPVFASLPSKMRIVYPPATASVLSR
jgi:hypothetical protein